MITDQVAESVSTAGMVKIAGIRLSAAAGVLAAGVPPPAGAPPPPPEAS